MAAAKGAVAIVADGDIWLILMSGLDPDRCRPDIWLNRTCYCISGQVRVTVVTT
ncbi:MAG: hypothetical protein R6V38_00150 [Roseovarius gahaiensis]